MRPVVLALVRIAFSFAPAAAQSGRIAGDVPDAAGAVLPGVTVTLFGGPGEPRVSVTDGAGRFVFAGPAAGRLPAWRRLERFRDGHRRWHCRRDRAGGGAAHHVGRWPASATPVVVTATCTEEPLRDVPMSISAFSRTDIERRDLEDVAELAHWTPGLTLVGPGRAGPRRADRARPAPASLNGSGPGDTGVAIQPRRRAVDVKRHRAGGGAARTTGDAARRGDADRRGAIPASPAGHGTWRVRPAHGRLRTRARRILRLRHRPHLQRASRSHEPRPTPDPGFGGTGHVGDGQREERR